jgi:hypothetical protein
LANQLITASPAGGNVGDGRTANPACHTHGHRDGIADHGSNAHPYCAAAHSDDRPLANAEGHSNPRADFVAPGFAIAGCADAGSGCAG